MIFVIAAPFNSSVLRGAHIAKALKAKALLRDIGNAKNETVVFIKDADRALVLKAKDRGNRIVYDPVDLYCYKGRECSFADLADVVLVPSRAAGDWYRTHGFSHARFALIPHQWDFRIKGIAQQDRCRPGYIGYAFNCPAWWDGESFTEMDIRGGIHQAAQQYNLHLSLNQRIDTHVLLKPATKIATASAVLANVVAYPDPAAVELLGADYPFLVQDDPQEAVRRCKGSFGGVEWKRGLDRMRAVRERTKLEAVAALYARLEQGEKRQAA